MHSRHHLIPIDAHSERGRATRPPLHTWAASLIHRLATLGPVPAAWDTIDGCMNNAGLIEVYRGDLGSAEEVCTLQVWWVARLVQDFGVLAAGWYALQPWINLGRLRRMRGDREGALRHFDFLVDTLARRPFCVASMKFDAATWQELVHMRSALPVLKAVYVVESVKTYFSAGDNQGAAEFLGQARDLMGDEPFLLLDEIELIALARMGRYEDATAVLERGSWQEDTYSKLLRVTYRAALHAAGGELAHARHLTTELVARVLQADSFEKPTDQRVLRYLDYLGGLASLLDLSEIAARIWRVGLSAARNLDDVPYRLALLEALLVCEGVDDVEALTAERAALLDECMYATLLKARALKEAPSALANPVFRELHRRLRTAVGADALGPDVDGTAPVPRAE